jgi:hypothetical protein
MSLHCLDGMFGVEKECLPLLYEDVFSLQFATASCSCSLLWSRDACSDLISATVVRSGEQRAEGRHVRR